MHVGVDSFPKDQELVSRRQGTLPYTGTIRSFPNLAPCKNQKIPHQGFLLLVKAGIPTISVTLDSHNYNQDFSNLDKERHRPRFRRGGSLRRLPRTVSPSAFFRKIQKRIEYNGWLPWCFRGSTQPQNQLIFDKQWPKFLALGTWTCSAAGPCSTST